MPLPADTLKPPATRGVPRPPLTRPAAGHPARIVGDVDP